MASVPRLAKMFDEYDFISDHHFLGYVDQFNGH